MTSLPGSLTVSGLTKTWPADPEPVRALDDVSLTVAAGEIIALLGNNGAGKSTLMNIVAGVARADAGEVRVCGERVGRGHGGPSRNVGYAPQEEALYPTLSTESNLRYFGRLAGLSGVALSERVAEVAQHLLLTDLLGQRAGNMSGGQRRRLHTALALMHRPTVLLLDEPTVGVDIGARAELLEFVRATADRGAAILYSTHQFAEIDALSARVVVIDLGRVLAAGSAADIAARYAPAGFELVFGDTNSPPSSLADRVDEAGWTPAGSYRVVVRRTDDRSVGDVVEALPADAHQRLLSATALEPTIERAYLRLVSARSDAPGGPDRVPVQEVTR